MAATPDKYLAAAPEVARPWLQEFWSYVASEYPSQAPTMFRGVPMFKFGPSYLDGYVMFTGAKAHFAAHAIDFDLVQQAKDAIPGSRGGKGSVAVAYTDEAAKPVLRHFVDEVMARHAIPRASGDAGRDGGSSDPG